MFYAQLLVPPAACFAVMLFVAWRELQPDRHRRAPDARPASKRAGGRERQEHAARMELYGHLSGSVAAAPTRPPIRRTTTTADADQASAVGSIEPWSEREAMWPGA